MVGRAARSGVFLAALLATRLLAAGEVEELAEAIASAVAGDRPIPDVPAAVDEATAYRIQALWFDDRYEKDIVGYKAGLTSAASQKRFGIGTPVLGILPGVARLTRLTSDAPLEMAPGLEVEVEIGIVVGVDGEPAALVPAVEFPRLYFAAPDALQLADVVASNVSAYRFVMGDAAPLDPAVRNTRVTLTRNGETVHEALATDALGDPLESARWMVAKIRELGYRLEPGMVLLTGALGRIVDAEPGNYVARFGELG